MNIKAGTDLSVGKNGLAQGSGNLLLFAGQDLRIAGTAGTAETAATGGGTLRAEAGRDILVTGTVTASSPASLSAQRHMSVDGTVTALSGDLTTQAGGDLKVAASGRCSPRQAGRQGGRRYRLGRHAGGRRRIGAGGHGDARLGGTIAALGTSVQSTPPAPGGRSLSAPASGDLSHIGRTRPDHQARRPGAGSRGLERQRRPRPERLRRAGLGARPDPGRRADARVDGSAASDARLTLNGRNITVADRAWCRPPTP